MSTIANASLKYHFITRPDLRKVCHFWNENEFIGPCDNIPGLKSISVKGVYPQPSSKAYMSQIEVSVSPSIALFEEKLLERVAINFLELHPELSSIGENGKLIPPIIKERRLLIGFHNSRTFLSGPVITNLHPIMNEEGQSSRFAVHGNVEINDYISKSSDVALILMVEYKVAFTNSKIEAKPNFISKMLKSGDSSDMLEKNEQVICVGWGYVQSQLSESVNCVYLNCASLPNPFGALVYQATPEAYETNFKGELGFKIEFAFTGSPQSNVNTPTQLVDMSSISTSYQNLLPPQIDIPARSAPESARQKSLDDDLEEIKEKVTPENVAAVPSASPKPKKRLSRVERARFLNAGFEKILDNDGNKLETYVPGNLPNLNLEQEFSDPMMNELHITFQGITYSKDFIDLKGG
jgi:hypothetical protein